MGKGWKRGMALLVASVMVFSTGPDQVRAAKKTVKLAKSSVTVQAGKTVKVKIKNTTGKKVQKVTCKITKGKKLVSIAKKKKSYISVKAKKKGTAKIKVTVQVKGKKTFVRNLKVKVKAAQTTTGGSETGNTEKSDNTGGGTGTDSGKNSGTENTGGNGTETAEDKTDVDSPEFIEGEDQVAVKELARYDMTVDSDGKTLLDKSGNGYNGTLSNVEAEKQEYDSLYLDGEKGYIALPKEIFVGKNNLTISIWVKNFTGNANTSAMFVGTKENNPVSYWLLNPSNPAGRMKSVFTNTQNANAPWNSEVGISPSNASKGVQGPKTGMVWNHYVTVITNKRIIGYLNGKKVGAHALSRTISDFGEDLAAYIGKSSYPDITLNGYVRQVQVFEGRKTDSEVEKLYEETRVEGMNDVDESKRSEIFIEDRADPYIVKGDDGYYYFTASYPMCGSTDREGYDRVILRRSKTLQGLQNAEEKTIWNQADSSKCFRFIWAPELHKIGGKWYVFFTASDNASQPFHIDCNVLMCKGDDPYTDGWEEKGKFQKAEGDNSFDGFSLDMTYFENNGKHYVIWAEKKDQFKSISDLYMAEIDPSEPWKCITKSMKLSAPTYSWEKRGVQVNEGPSVIKHGDKVIVAFSASATGPEYCVGLIWAKADSDLMDKKSWTKQEKAALTSQDLVEEYGPGHNSFTVDEDGNPIFVYHSRPKNCLEGSCGYSDQDPLFDPCRSAHLRKVTWDENGLPVLNSEPLNFQKKASAGGLKLTSENDLGGYLYVCFADTKSGKDVQQLHFFLSPDGLNWSAVNGCMPAYMAGTQFPTDSYAFEKDWKGQAASAGQKYNATPGAATNGAFYKAADIAGTVSGDASALFPFEGRDHGLRDPYLIRGCLKDGSDKDTVRILATDLNVYGKQYGNVNWGLMTSSKQAGDNCESDSKSAGSKQLFIFETKDFVHWDRRTVDVAKEIKGGCAWAPEAIYNPQKDNYLVYWSCRTETDGFARNRLYCNETKDFKTFGPTKLYEEEPFYKDWQGRTLFKGDDGYGNIDTSQLWVAEGDNPYGKLYRLVKDETDNHVQLMKADSVLDPAVDYDSSDPNRITPCTEGGVTYSSLSDIAKLASAQKAPVVWNWFIRESTGNHFEKVSQKHMECFNGAFEGPTMFKFIDRDEWCIMIDNYGDHSIRYEPYLTTDLSRPESVRKADSDSYGRTDGDVGCHGGVIPITVKEYNQIIATYNSRERYCAITGIAADKIGSQKNIAGCVYHDIAPLKLSQ